MPPSELSSLLSNGQELTASRVTGQQTAPMPPRGGTGAPVASDGLPPGAYRLLTVIVSPVITSNWCSQSRTACWSTRYS